MKKDSHLRPIVMTIAGLDPSGGAGILADARTISAFGCYPVAVVTAITFQNAAGVSGVLAQDPGSVRGQLLPIFNGLTVSAIKTGMMPTREVVREVAQVLREHPTPSLVIDPVMQSTSGYKFMDDDTVAELRGNLLPLATVVTPNVPEAERLVGFSIQDEATMRRAAEAIRRSGVKAVLIKGGHLDSGTEVIDVLDSHGDMSVFRSERVHNGEFRGTGCALASGIASCLAQGHSLEESVRRAREFVREAMQDGVTMGGKGILFKLP
jgi:hydroxymethylpyrimidine/phosphomethylpyrimidine kinase